eukprot:EG_transcript_7129
MVQCSYVRQGHHHHGQDGIGGREATALYHLASIKDRELEVAGICQYLSHIEAIAEEVGSTLTGSQGVQRATIDARVPLQGGKKEAADPLGTELALLSERSTQRAGRLKALADAQRQKREREKQLRQEMERKQNEQKQAKEAAKAEKKTDESAKEGKPVPSATVGSVAGPETAAVLVAPVAATPPAPAPTVAAPVAAPAPPQPRAEPASAAAASSPAASAPTPAAAAASPAEEFRALKAEFAPLEAALKAQAQSSPEAKKTFLDIKREILPKVQAIVPAIPVCKRVVNELCAVLGRHEGEPLHAFHAMLCLAMKFVPAGATGDVGEHLVYPYAAVAVHVGLAFPKLLRVWAWCMYSQCPLTIPTIPTASTIDACLDRKGAEDVDAWGSRVALFLRQYAALLQTAVHPALVPDVVRARCGAELPANPMGLDKAWGWLATVINVPPEAWMPRKDIWTTALAGMLTKAGYAMLQRYRTQFAKLLAAIETQYMPLVQPGPTDSVTHRVAVQLLQDFFAAYHSAELLPPEGSVLDATGTGQAGVDSGASFGGGS